MICLSGVKVSGCFEKTWFHKIIRPARRGLLTGLLAGSAFSGAQAAEPDPFQIFAPLSYPQPVNLYHSGNGAPGPMAWKNRADYNIHVHVDPATHTLSGSETLTYTNNSPESLSTLWLQLDQNIYQQGSRGAYAAPQRLQDHTDGMIIEAVALSADGKETPLTPLVSDTRMQVPRRRLCRERAAT